MRLLSLAEITKLHRLVIEKSGGSYGIRDLGILEAAVAQPRMSFGGQDLYPSVIEKAAALGASLVQNGMDATTSRPEFASWAKLWTARPGLNACRF